MCVCARARCLHRARFVSPDARDAENQYGIFSFRPVNSADMNFSADRIPAFVSRTSNQLEPTSNILDTLASTGEIIVFSPFFPPFLLWMTPLIKLIISILHTNSSQLVINAVPFRV